MTASAKGTLEEPGRNVAAKSGLNRSVLDVGFGEIRRQIEYKTRWYGSRMVLADRYAPTSKTCSMCGTARAKLSLAEREYHCTLCGTRMDRDVNAARCILTAAGVVMHHDARGKQESQTADRAGAADTSTAPATTSEGQGHQAPATPTEESAGHPQQTQRGAA